VLLTSEPTAAFAEEQTILLPGGTVDDGETPEQAANRELQEEIGYRAAQLTLIGEVRPWIKYLSTRTYLFLGRELRPATLVGDEDYAISLVRQPLDRFEALIEEGRLRDARVIAALYMAREFLRRQALGR
jgi:ADP-ribose diphosphatase